MCYEADSLPPYYGPPITTTTSCALTLTASDGAECAAFQSVPAKTTGPGVLVLPDNRGLSIFYEALTRRLAEQGLSALALDYFGRSAGTAYRERPADFGRPPGHMAHLRALTRDGLYADFDAGIEYLRSLTPAVISLGFCMGGRFAFLTAERRFGLAGVVGLYGFPDALNGAPGPLQSAAQLTAPVLGMFAGADEGIPPQLVSSFDDALAAAGNQREIITYPGTPHGFFEAAADPNPHEAACADVWRRVLAFASEHAA